MDFAGWKSISTCRADGCLSHCVFDDARECPSTKRANTMDRIANTNRFLCRQPLACGQEALHLVGIACRVHFLSSKSNRHQKKHNKQLPSPDLRCIHLIVPSHHSHNHGTAVGAVFKFAVQNTISFVSYYCDADGYCYVEFYYSNNASRCSQSRTIQKAIRSFVRPNFVQRLLFASLTSEFGAAFFSWFLQEKKPTVPTVTNHRQPQHHRQRLQEERPIDGTEVKQRIASNEDDNEPLHTRNAVNGNPISTRITTTHKDKTQLSMQRALWRNKSTHLNWNYLLWNIKNQYWIIKNVIVIIIIIRICSLFGSVRLLLLFRNSHTMAECSNTTSLVHVPFLFAFRRIVVSLSLPIAFSYSCWADSEHVLAATHSRRDNNSNVMHRMWIEFISVRSSDSIDFIHFCRILPFRRHDEQKPIVKNRLFYHLFIYLFVRIEMLLKVRNGSNHRSAHWRAFGPINFANRWESYIILFI